MHAATATEVPAARSPQPAHEGLFREPVYPDGPYLRDEDQEDDDTET
jgi:hypothetical protein